MRFDLLDPDQIRELGAEAEARVADLADEIGIAAQELDALFFAEAQFAQTRGNFGRSGELLDAHGIASLHLAQRAEQGGGIVSFRLVGDFVHAA